MTLVYERYVASRFDAVADRFRADVPAEDYRLAAIVRHLFPRGGVPADEFLIRGRRDACTTKEFRVLDLGCGKGRFARHLSELGAEVVGLDPSSGMLAHANGLDRVRGSATRLPFASGQFDAAIAIEVFEHLPPKRIDAALAEVARVLAPGGKLAIVDKNILALDANRPWLPKFAVKWIDEHRGRWMYPSGGPVRERWFLPGGFANRMRATFDEVQIEHLLSPEEAHRAVFRRVPIARLMTLWTARAPGGPRG